MKYNYSDIGTRFRNERKKICSQEEFVGKMRDGLVEEDDKTKKEKIIREPCRISRNTLSALENGDILEKLTLKQFLTMCEILGCDAAYLLGECKEHIYNHKYIRETIGLSEQSIKKMIKWQRSGFGDFATDFISRMIENEEVLPEILRAGYEYGNIEYGIERNSNKVFLKEKESEGYLLLDKKSCLGFLSFEIQRLITKFVYSYFGVKEGETNAE